MSEKSDSYYRGFNGDLLDSIPATCSRVLEFGCAGGHLGEAYKQRNAAASWVGVELLPEVAEVARGRIDEVRIGDATAPSLLGSLPSDFDCLVYGDLVEHLPDPEPVLRRHLDLLCADGWMVVSIPNVQHWSVLYDLLSGRWSYRRAGIMDSTHLRFFTLDSAARMLRSLGLSLVGARQRGIPPGSKLVRSWEHHRAFSEDLISLCEKYGMDQEMARFQAYQYVIVARKPRGGS